MGESEQIPTRTNLYKRLVLKKDRIYRYSSKHPLKGAVTIENRHLSMAIFEITELKLMILVFSESCRFLSVSLPTPFSILTMRVKRRMFPLHGRF